MATPPSSIEEQLRSGKRKRKSNASARQEDSSFPERDCDKLFVQDATVNCALHSHCVPCAYKIGCFDVALDQEFTKAVPNQRPEQCPRAKASRTTRTPREGTLGYRSGMNVLTVGDGDLSFSLAIARLLAKEGNGLNGQRLIATSYESRETLERVYPNFRETAEELESYGAHVEYEVDATRLSDNLSLSNMQEIPRFHRIVWNFPCTAISQGQDGQNAAMEDNKELIRRFVRDARHLLDENGEIHMSHKTKPPYNQWKLEEVAIEKCKDDPAVEYQGRVVLDKFTFVPYTPRKALDRKSFPCHDACTFIFGTSSGNNSSYSCPSSIPDSNVTRGDREDNVSVLVPVTRALIERIREKHLHQCSIRKQKSKHKKRNKRSYKGPNSL